MTDLAKDQGVENLENSQASQAHTDIAIEEEREKSESDTKEDRVAERQQSSELKEVKESKVAGLRVQPSQTSVKQRAKRREER